MFGHGTAPYSILPKIEQAIEDHYTKYGVTAFYVGSRGQFYSMAATAVKQVKQRHPDILLFLVARQRKQLAPYGSTTTSSSLL
jgi:hypothetical protein